MEESKLNQLDEEGNISIKALKGQVTNTGNVSNVFQCLVRLISALQERRETQWYSPVGKETEQLALQ